MDKKPSKTAKKPMNEKLYSTAELKLAESIRLACGVPEPEKKPKAKENQ